MNTIDGDLWIPRTMWEKRRQLSGVVQRSVAIGQSMLVMSCDDWTTFRNRLDAILPSGGIEYLQVSPLMGDGSAGVDLSRVMGRLGPKSEKRRFDLVLVDDVDLIIDLRSEETAVASMFALLYALKARFDEIVLFSNPLRTQWELEYLNGMRDFLRIHAPSPQTFNSEQNVA